jgi:SPP1 family predicted phage head-tail adaptor
MGRIAAGTLNQRIALLTDVLGPEDGEGGRLPGLTTEKGLWARVRPLRTGEKSAVGLTLNPEAYEITIRHLPFIAPTQRVRWKGKLYQIEGVTPDEYEEYLLLTCTGTGQLAPAPIVMPPASGFPYRFPLSFGPAAGRFPYSLPVAFV